MSENDGVTRFGFVGASTDEPVLFPKGQGTYCGFVSMPTSGSVSTTGVVLLAGTGAGTGTIGRNRMWVKMARRLADSGIPTLRFDYAGFGDSDGEVAGYDLDAPAISALKAAFDLLSSRGVDEFLLVGTCFGARTALAGSVDDPRVAGLHLLVPPVRATRKGAGGAEHLADYAGAGSLARKAVAPRTIKRLVTSKGARKAARQFLAVKTRRTRNMLSGVSPDRPNQAKEASPGFRRPLRNLLSDGVPVHFLYGLDDFYWTEFEHATRGRLGEDLERFSDFVDVETVPGTVRGFPSIRVQELVIDSAVTWVKAHSSGRANKHTTVSDVHTRIGRPDDATEEMAYFGASPRMYGVTHLPNGDRRASVVICSSTHAELLKSYRLEVVLARELAARGFAVQRFHYKGEGNSEGDLSELTLPAMVDAARQATSRILDNAGTGELVFVGVRLGAYPATILATEFDGTPLVFWDPVLDTDRFMKDALRTHAIAAIKGEAKPESAKQSLQRLDRDGSIDLLGYDIRSTFHSSIKGKKLSDYSPEGSDVLVVPFGNLDTEALAQVWANEGIPLATLDKADGGAWWLVEEVTEDRLKRGENLAARTADWIAAATS
ncbi:MAG: alpha/beta fold hydrolase [Acidimicrobiia bacterium]